MKPFVFALCMILSFSISACGGTMKQYARANVEILSVQADPAGSTTIIYRPLLESLYYCPGATLWVDADRQKVSLVRCKFNDQCAVNVDAQDLGNGQWRIRVPDVPDKIDLVFRDGEMPLSKVQQ